MTEELPEINYREFFCWLLRRRKRFRVTGNSMLPVLQPEAEILVDTQAYAKTLPEIGDIVVAIHPLDRGLMIKRVALVEEDGSCVLLGDNKLESSDSRTFGAVSAMQILGKVTSRFA